MSKLSNLKIVPFQVVEIRQLVDVIDAVCADTPWMQTRRFEPTGAWQHALMNQDCHCHALALAKVDHQIVGWYRLFPVDDLILSSVELGIGVLSLYRRKGLGMAMMTCAISWARERKLSQIVLTTHVQNRQAIKLFEKVGFKINGSNGSRLRMNLDNWA